MLKTSKLLTITVPKSTYATIQREAKKRKDTVSGMLRKAFEQYSQSTTDIYSNTELRQILQQDKLSKNLRADLDQLLGKK